MTVKRLAPLLIALVCMLAPQTGTAKDYDRNDVSAREIGLMIARTSLQGGPFATLVRGAARRHTRFFYVGTEVMVGTTFEPTIYGSFGVLAGVETAQDSYKKVRGYAEVGASAQWSRSTVFEVLNLHLETGVRLQLHTVSRPHMYTHVGLRVMSSFRTYGVGLVGGMGWTFD
ncbi:MAG: hypothetical protein KC502_01935 [Myxococcales bacterium]|nr:hypothetical protein [Myxococcales bacterium]